VRADTTCVTRRSLVIVLAIATGVVVELGIEVMSGRREAWDSEFYWMIGLPAAMLMSLLVGFISERRDWLWAAAIVPSQVTTMMATSGDLLGGLGLWPLMVAFSSILSAPFVGASYVGSWLRRGTVRQAQ